MATTTDRLHTKVTADTTQARRSMRNYGAAGKRAGASITSGFAKFGLAMAGVQAGIALVSSAFQQADFANEIGRLREVVTDTFGKELARATGGTVSQLEALQFGARSMTGDFRLTREEMKLVLAQADDLAKRGFGNTAKIANELSEALNTGRVNSLAKYGVSVDRDLKQPTEKAAAVLASLREQSKNPLANDEAKTNFDKFKSEMANATNSMREFFGGIVTEITLAGAAALQAFRTIARLTDSDEQSKKFAVIEAQAKAVAEVRARDKFGEKGDAGFFSLRSKFDGANLAREVREREIFVEQERLKVRRDLFNRFNLERANAAADEEERVAEETAKILAGRQTKITGESKAKRASSTTEDTSPFLGAEGSVGTLLAESETFERRIEHLRALEEARRAAVENQEELDNRSRASSIRVAEELKRIEEEKRAAFQASVEGLSSSAQSMIEIGETLFGKSKALEVLNAIIMVAKETALAASAFATGNIPGGIAHVAAGVSWGAVAAKAGGGGGGGGGSASSSRGAAGGGFARSSGGSSGGGSSSIVVNVGSDFIGKPDELATAITTRIRSAERRGSIQPRENDVVLHT